MNLKMWHGLVIFLIGFAVAYYFPQLPANTIGKIKSR